MSQNGRRLPARRSGRECNGRSPPTPSRARRAPSAPDEGRCHADPHCTRDGTGRHCCSSRTISPCRAVPPQFRRGPPTTRRPAHTGQRRSTSKLMSYAQAQQVAKLATFYNAVAAREEEATYLKDSVAVPQGRCVPQGGAVPQGRCVLQGGSGAEAAAAGRRASRRAGSRPRRQRQWRQQCQLPPQRRHRHRHRRRHQLVGRRMPPARTRRIGPASATTSPATTTPRVAAVHTSSSSGLGSR